jgi:hypothetical protein
MTASPERGRRFKRTGANIALAGVVWGLVRSILFGHNTALLVIAFGMVTVGLVVWVVGLVLERSARQSDFAIKSGNQ